MAVRAIAVAALGEVQRQLLLTQELGFDELERPTSRVRKLCVILHALIEALKEKGVEGRKAARNPWASGSSHAKAPALACLSRQLNRQSEIARPQSGVNRSRNRVPRNSALADDPATDGNGCGRTTNGNAYVSERESAMTTENPTTVHLRAFASTPQSALRQPQSTIAWAAAMFCGAMMAFAPPTLADDPPCLPDSNGDGHPLFGNPKYDRRLGSPVLRFMYPEDLARGDLDGDGDIDLVIAHSGGYDPNDYGDMTVMLNYGDGLFVEDAYYTAGLKPRSVALGDLDGDGDLDMAVASPVDDAVFVLLGVGDGTFQMAQSFTAGDRPRSVAIGDVDGDLVPDLVVVNGGLFTGTYPWYGSISVLMGRGDGTFAREVNYFLGPYVRVPVYGGGSALVLGDLDADGDLDLAVARLGFCCASQAHPSCWPPDPGDVRVLLNNGDGRFGSFELYSVEAAPVSLAIGDLDGDGDLDLVAGNNCGYVGECAEYLRCGFTVSALLNHGNGTFAPQVSYETNGYGVPLPPGVGARVNRVALGDTDGDGDLDLAVGHSDDRVSLLPGNGDGTLGAETTLIVDVTPAFVDLVDLNGDGGLDLAVLAHGNHSLSLIFNYGDGVFLDDEIIEMIPSTQSGPRSAAIGDLDGDGDLDLATARAGPAGTGTAGMTVLLNDGNATFVVVPYEAGYLPWSIAMGDVDADGDLDLAVANGMNGIDNTVSVFLNNGDGTFAGQVKYDAGFFAISVAIGDLDHDGDGDLAVANIHDYTVSVLLSNGDGTFLQQVEYPAGNYPWAVAIGDLDGDTHPDLVTVNGWPHGVNVLFNTGDGTFGAAVVAYGMSSGPEPLCVSLGDLDADGDLDVVVGFSSLPQQPNVQVLLNDGSGALSDGGSYLVPGTWQTESVAIGDLNGDGVPDLALGNAAMKSVSVLLGHGDGTFGAGVVYAKAKGAYASVVLGDLDGDGDLDLAVTNDLLWHTGLSVLLNRACDLVGDCDGSGAIDMADVPCFVACLLDPAPQGCRAADMNADGTPDGLDIAWFVDALFNALQPGACCRANNTCTEVYAWQCGGQFHGDGTTCAGTCLPGACCLENGICSEVWEVVCANLGGTFQGGGTTCPTDCPIFPPPEITAASFTPLSVSNCPDPSALVFATIEGNDFVDGATATLVQAGQPDVPGFNVVFDSPTLMTADFDLGGMPAGTWQAVVTNPEGQSSNPSPEALPVWECPIAACCLPDGSCAEIPEQSCVDAGGDYQGDEVTCAAAGCPLGGACCSLIDGSCAVLTEFLCETSGGIYQGDSVPCLTNPPTCPFGRYSNEIDPVGGSLQGQQFADDMTLAGTGARNLVYLDLMVSSYASGGLFDLTVELYTDCPGDGGTLIPGATFTWVDLVADGDFHVIAADPISPPVAIPDMVWMVATFSTPYSKWAKAGGAEVGFTSGYTGQSYPPWSCNNTGTVGFWANLICVE